MRKIQTVEILLLGMVATERSQWILVKLTKASLVTAIATIFKPIRLSSSQVAPRLFTVIYTNFPSFTDVFIAE